MSKKYYAVLEGRHPGIYETWTEAKDEVHGYPGALYQSFKNLADAKNYLNQAQSQKQKSPSDQLIAYVDGSFDKKSESYSFGAVLILNNQVIKTLSRVGNNPKYQSSRQIAGEVFGALHAIDWAIQNDFKKITIHYDYLGIEKWALGEWRTNKAVSIDYAQSFQELASKIEIQFVKVKAHAGVEYNEMADQIAKDALEKSKNKH